jgi:hypothetical protein
MFKSGIQGSFISRICAARKPRGPTKSMQAERSNASAARLWEPRRPHRSKYPLHRNISLAQSAVRSKQPASLQRRQGLPLPEGNCPAQRQIFLKRQCESPPRFIDVAEGAVPLLNLGPGAALIDGTVLLLFEWRTHLLIHFVRPSFIAKSCDNVEMMPYTALLSAQSKP